MAGPSVAVRVLGDVKGLVDTFSGVGDKAKTAAASAHEAFGGMLDALNKTGVLGPFGEALDGIDQAIGKVAEHGKAIAPAMMGVGGALVGIGAGLQAVGSKDQAAHQQLQAAVEASGKDYEEYAALVEAAIKKNEKYGDSADKTQDALRILTQATGDPARAIQYLGTATDLAAAKHESLDTAATQLGKTFNGSGKILKEFGVEAAPKATQATKELESATNESENADQAAIKAKQTLADLNERLAGKTHLTVVEQQQLRNAQEKVVESTGKQVAAHEKLKTAQENSTKATTGQEDQLTSLSDKLKGQASAAADTFSGRMAAIKAQVEDAAAAFGQKYGPAITAAGAVMTGLGATMEVTKGIMSLFSGTQEAVAVAEGLAAGAAGVEAGAMDTAAASATAADVAASPIIVTVGLIVAGIAILGIAVYELYTHWSTVWDAMKQATEFVWNWIRTNWPLLVAIILGPFAVAALEINRHWGEIRQGASDVWSWITGKFNDLVGYFTGLPGRMSRAVSGMWDGIYNAFHSVINEVINLWNKLHFSLPKIDWGPVHLDAGSIGVPYISPLAAGGIVTSPTLALIGEKGPEAVIPLGRGMGTGVHIENVNISDGADVDLLIHKLAFAATAGRL